MTTLLLASLLGCSTGRSEATMSARKFIYLQGVVVEGEMMR